jgi:branched-chain amino acid transport system substrate-binding protein
VKEDDAADPSVGVSKVRKLIEKDEVDVVVATVHSGVAAAIRNYIVDAKKLWLNPIATNDVLAESGCSRYHFRFSASGWQASAPTASWARTKLQSKTRTCARSTSRLGSRRPPTSRRPSRKRGQGAGRVVPAL